MVLVQMSSVVRSKQRNHRPTVELYSISIQLAIWLQFPHQNYWFCFAGTSVYPCADWCVVAGHPMCIVAPSTPTKRTWRTEVTKRPHLQVAEGYFQSVSTWTRRSSERSFPTSITRHQKALTRVTVTKAARNFDAMRQTRHGAWRSSDRSRT